MATRFYFHAASNALSGTFPTTEQSTLTAAANVDAQTVNRNMNTTIGSNAATLAIGATVSTRDLYFTKFVSPLIYQTSIAANTWVYGFGAKESILTANFPCSGTNQPVYINIYVWRPSTGAKIGTILDGNTASTVDEGGTAGLYTNHLVNCTGASVAGLTSGDAVIIAEIWFRITSTNVGTMTYLYDGGTDPTENVTNSDAASYLETPENLSFSVGGQNIVKSLTETVTLSHSVTRIGEKIRPISQTIAITETATRQSTKIRIVPAQTVAITDTNLVRIRGLVRGPTTQTIAIAEASLTRRTTKTRSPATQTIVISETLTRLATKIRALAVQTVTVSESLIKQSTKKRAPATESITVSEGLARRATKSKALSTQSIAVSESLTRIKGVLRALPTQTVAVSEVIARTVVHAGGNNITRAVPTQTITVSDAIIRRVDKIRALAVQTITVSDVLNRLAVKTKALPTQTIIVSESLARIKGKTLALATQTVTVSDILTRKTAKIRGPSVQTVVVSDSITRLASKIRAIPTQTVTVSEVIARTVIHGANNIVRVVPTQTVTVADSITRKTDKIRALPTQIVTITDSIIKITAKARALPAQTVTVTDAITRTVSHGLNLVRTLTQNITVGESLARRTTKIRALPTQTIAITDSVIKSVGKIRILAVQTVTIGESLTKKLAKTRIIAQIVSVIEQEIKIFKNGILIVPIQRPDKGGWFWKPPRIKMIRYPVYIVPERIRLERRRKLREYPPLIVIPAFKYSINEVVAPFVITNPISQTVQVRFAISNQIQTKRIRYSGLAIPINVVPQQSHQKRLNTARCASFIANPEAISRYSKKLNKFAKVLRLWSIAQQVFTSEG